MRPTTLTITATGTSQAVPLDRYAYGYAVAVQVSSSAVSFTVQHTFDDPGLSNLNLAGQGTWYNHDDPVMVNASSNVASNYGFAPRAVRVVATGSAPRMSLTIVPIGDIC